MEAGQGCPAFFLKDRALDFRYLVHYANATN
jgi:hypothetical protein